MTQSQQPLELWSRSEGQTEPKRIIVTPGGLTPKGQRKRGKGKAETWTFTVPNGVGTDGAKVYQSAKSLLIDLAPEGRGLNVGARHWTLDRYFGMGRFEQPSVVGLTILEILDPSNALELQAPTPRGLGLILDPTLVPLGIDLAKRGDEVAKLLFSGFGHAIHSAGLDPEDVLQEVLAGILIRNKGTCPFDSRKASFGHYVHMVCECVMSNVHRKNNRMRSREQTGAIGFSADGDGSSCVDASDSMMADQAAITIAETEGHPMDRYMFTDLFKYISTNPKGQSVDARVALLALPYVQEGYGRAEIAESLGISKAAVSRALTFLRRTVREWLAL